jgi:hypothetical protein
MKLSLGWFRAQSWKKLVQERGWVDLYMPSDQFATLQTRISALMADLCLAPPRHARDEMRLRVSFYATRMHSSASAFPKWSNWN